MANRSRRIGKEMEDLRRDALSGMSAEPINDDISHLRGAFKGPPGTPSQTGAICLDTLSAAWSPVLTIKSALLSLQSLLATPEPKDPQDAEVAGMLLRNPKQFEEIARQWAVQYAGAPAKASSGSSSNAVDARREREAEERRKAQQELLRQQQLEGYASHLFTDFEAMGFDIPRVVRILKGMGIPKTIGRLPNNISEEIVERLLSST
ncbi:uncharacterized protein DFL_001319 [Arthrobotrys flagrans]|uniref:UBC core domain-containing protein n=1 Tax=Arthrobotrys flagrans TaxID=97331 RepID=A0A437AGT2_ARTFL|nr:hypothetical protein DFL_001319 [Arthrobotrys flagrans]